MINENGKITTQGIKYAGSKLKIIPYIVQIVSSLKGVKSVLDGFSGTTRVSQAFAQLGYDTTSNDLAVWSEVFATCYLKADKPVAYYQEIIDELNALKGVDGWFTENYGGDEAKSKKPFQRKNTQKLDAIRCAIDQLQLSWEDRCVMLTSLILALDKVDSTMGHYVSYLSDWSPRSYKDLLLKVPERYELTGKNIVMQGDVFDAIKQDTYDFVYFDPPYGSNNGKMPSSRVRYQSYYHLWTSVIQNDQAELFGKANRREDTRDRKSVSVFEEFKKDEQDKFIALEALKKLIDITQARYVLLSYSSGGKATKEELSEIITTSGKLIKAIEIDYKKNVMGNMRWTNEWVNSDGKHHEYLFLMKKG
ncbi:MAG: DNA adenine methylase [Paludibacter sp.]|nr:DNA adenine methylase [Paludibacter sp.]